MGTLTRQVATVMSAVACAMGCVTIPVLAADQPLPAGLEGRVNTTYFLPDFSIALFVHPKQLLAIPMLQDKQFDTVLSDTAQELGFDIRQLDEAVLFAGPREPAPGEEPGPPVNAIILRSSVPFDVPKLEPTLFRRLKRSDEPGAKVWLTDAKETSAALVGDRTLILAEQPYLKRMLSKPKVTSTLIRALEQADARRPVNLMVAADALRKALEKEPLAWTPLFEMYIKLLTLTPALEASIASDLSVEVVVRTQSAEAAQEAETLAHGMITSAKVAVAFRGAAPPQPLSAGQTFHNLANRLEAALEPKIEKHAVVARLTAAQGQEQAKAALADFLPLVVQQLKHVREARTRTEATSQ